MRNRPQILLSQLGACSIAIRSITNQNQEDAWNNCTVGAWLHWLIDRLVWGGYLDSKYLVAASRALRNSGSTLTPAQRVLEAVPYSVIAKALTICRKRTT